MAGDSLDSRMPADLNTRGCTSGLLEVNRDKLIIKYSAAARHQSEVAAIQSLQPVPLDCRIGYFEATVLSPGSGPNSKIGIGFSDEHFQTNKLPGCASCSWGYHGYDGKKYHDGPGQVFSEPYGKGAVIGAGYHVQRQEVFFTKNGVKLATAFYGVRGSLYPTVGLHSAGASVQINFGSAPFAFDIKGMVEEERRQEATKINSMHVPISTAHQLVQDYLLHYGYAGTLQAFQEAAGTDPSTSRSAPWEVTTLPFRQQVRQRVVAGDTAAAVQLLKEQYPSLLSDTGGDLEVAFYLYCQQYIDLIRGGQVEQAVAFAQQKLWPLRPHQHSHPEQDLQAVIALAAYKDPEASPLAHLLSLQQRERTADVANAAILSLDPSPSAAPAARAALERVLQQLAGAHAVLREEAGDQGEVFLLQDHLGGRRGVGMGRGTKEKVL